MKPLLTAVLLLVACASFGQKNSDSLFFARMPLRKISVSEKLGDTIYNLPFHHVAIWDARADTTSIGFIKYQSTVTPKYFTDKLCFEKGLSNTFTDFVYKNHHLTSDSNDLLILVKTFRISNYISINGLDEVNVAQWRSGSILSAELFLRADNKYHALYKIDTIIVETSPKETFTELVVKSFNAILKKSQGKSLSEMHVGKTAFSYDDVQKHVEDFYNYKILKDDVLNKGVYKNFSEFLSNNPSLKKFEVKKGELSDELFVTEGNQSYPIQDFWGYCDGKNLFIYSAKNLFQIYRRRNTFITRAMKSFKTRQEVIKDTTTHVLINLIVTNRQSTEYLNNGKFKPDVTAFQLDMQTGEIY